MNSQKINKNKLFKKNIRYNDIEYLLNHLIKKHDIRYVNPKLILKKIHENKTIINNQEDIFDIIINELKDIYNHKQYTSYSKYYYSDKENKKKKIKDLYNTLSFGQFLKLYSDIISKIEGGREEIIDISLTIYNSILDQYESNIYDNKTKVLYTNNGKINHLIYNVIINSLNNILNHNKFKLKKKYLYQRNKMNLNINYHRLIGNKLNKIINAIRRLKKDTSVDSIQINTVDNNFSNHFNDKFKLLHLGKKGNINLPDVMQIQDVLPNGECYYRAFITGYRFIIDGTNIGFNPNNIRNIIYQLKDLIIFLLRLYQENKNNEPLIKQTYDAIVENYHSIDNYEIESKQVSYYGGSIESPIISYIFNVDIREYVYRNLNNNNANEYSQYEFSENIDKVLLLNDHNHWYSIQSIIHNL